MACMEYDYKLLLSRAIEGTAPCLRLQDGEVRKAFQRALTKQGLKFKLGYKVQSATVEGDSVKLEIEAAKGGKQETLEADIVLVSAGQHRLSPSASYTFDLSGCRQRCLGFPELSPATLCIAESGARPLRGQMRLGSEYRKLIQLAPSGLHGLNAHCAPH